MRLIAAAVTFGLSACASAPSSSGADTHKISLPDRQTEIVLDRIAAETGIVTAGFGVIRDGELVWTHYYGEQAPGVAAGPSTMFNVASITKTVSAETALRLAANGNLDLDEPLSAYWVDPDIAGDPLLDKLTARTVLTHSTGFPNWRFFRDDRKLAFESEPGSRFTYSGEGFDYLARALERKLDRSFPDLVSEMVFSPAGVEAARLAVNREDTVGIARPVDENGKFYGYYCYPFGWCREEGTYSAADDMVVSIPDYARFLISVMNADGYDETLEGERNRVQTNKGSESVIDCVTSKPCPVAQGYGLGFDVINYGDFAFIGHGGSDWAEVAAAYFYAPSKDGVLIFLNAPNIQALEAMPQLLAAIDGASPYIGQYARWLARERQQQETE